MNGQAGGPLPGSVSQGRHQSREGLASDRVTFANVTRHQRRRSQVFREVNSRHSANVTPGGLGSKRHPLTSVFSSLLTFVVTFEGGRGVG